MAEKKILLQKVIDGTAYQILPKTDASITRYMKTVDQTTTETTVAAELAALEANKMTSAQVDAKVAALKEEIIGTLGDNENLSETFDTIKEIDEYLTSHKDSVDALASLISDVGHASAAGETPVAATGLHANVETLEAAVEALQTANGTNVATSKTIEGTPTAAGNGRVYLDGVLTTIYDDSVLNGLVGTRDDAAAAAGTTLWSRVKQAEGDIDALENGLGVAADNADSAGTTAWSRLKNAEGDIDTLQASVGAATDTAAANGTTLWARLKALEEADGTNVSKTKTVDGTTTNAANGHLFLDGTDTTVYDDADLWASVGRTTDTAAANGTTAWARVKNAESDIDTLEAAVGAATDTANASGTTAWSRLKNAESDIDAIEGGLGTSADTANASGTTAWSRLKALEAEPDAVQLVASSAAVTTEGVLYMVELA